MNKLLKPCLTLGTLLITSTSFAQLQIQSSPKEVVIGTVKQGGRFQSELSYTVDDDKDTTYTLTYRNARYTTLTDIESVRFNEDGGTLNQLYEIMMSVFSDENIKNKDYKVEFKLGDKQVIVSNYRMMGISGAMFFTTDGYTILTKNQVGKLFGK